VGVVELVVSVDPIVRSKHCRNTSCRTLLVGNFGFKAAILKWNICLGNGEAVRLSIICVWSEYCVQIVFVQ
jgi:hypothetical protein